jgi:small subunit ribosomal protein S5
MAKINADTLNLAEPRVIRTNKVQKTHKGGRTMSWSILVVVGDENGHVGAGIGKARAIPDAIRKGTEAAKKNIIRVKIVDGTLPHDVLAQHGASEVLLRPAAPGTGVVAGGAVRVILEYAGVRDVLAKSLGSNNPVNNAWATLTALQQLRTLEDVASLRGKTPQEVRRGAQLNGNGNSTNGGGDAAAAEAVGAVSPATVLAGVATAKAEETPVQTTTEDAV